MRRVIAAAGGAGSSGPAHLSLFSDDDQTLPSAPTPGELAPDTVGGPVLIHDFPEPFVDNSGLSFAVRVYGQGRSDGAQTVSR